MSAKQATDNVLDGIAGQLGVGKKRHHSRHDRSNRGYEHSRPRYENRRDDLTRKFGGYCQHTFDLILLIKLVRNRHIFG